MKFCQRHWAALRKAIDDLGLTPQVSTSGEEAARRLQDGAPDPLMAAHNMILIRCIEYVGPALLVDEPGADTKCPQCEVSKACAGGCGRDGCGDDMTEGATKALAKQLAEDQGRTA